MSTGDLPKVHVRIERDTCPNCRCNASEEDKRLTKWKTWMDVRKDTHRRIAAQTGRESGDMIMNSAEQFRENVEDRLIMQYTKIPTKLDRYRGCPGFYDLPHSLFERQFKRSPAYFSVKTKEQRCLVPEMEYVRTDAVIRTEKGITPAKNRSKLVFLKSKYLERRRRQLREDLLEIEPHKPTGDLTVVGTAALKRDVFNFHLGDSCLSTESLLEAAPLPFDTNYPIFEINGEMIYVKSEGLKQIPLLIDFDVSSKSARMDLLSIRNCSSKAIRFSFDKVVVRNNFEAFNMIYEVQRQGFFFNLNKFVVVPQQTVRLPVHFKSRSQGMYKELWDLVIEPDLWRPRVLRVQLKLTCVALLKSFDVRCAALKENLHNRVRERIIDETLRKILATMPERRAEYTVYSYDKATLFEAINSSFSPVSLRPQYIYSKAAVGELEDFYGSIKLERHPDVWNLNLNTLRQFTVERELYEKELRLREQHAALEGKLLKTAAIRNAREELRRKLLAEGNAALKGDSKQKSKKGKKSPKSSKGKASKSPTRKGKKGKGAKGGAEHPEVVVPLIRRYDVPKSLTQQLEDIVGKLHRPITWANEQQRKLECAFLLFCAYFDKIQCDVDVLNRDFKTGLVTTYPPLAEFTPPAPVRMISEYHDDTLMQVRKFHEPCGSLKDKPAEPWTDEIPMEDYEKRYRAFHCIDLEATAVKGKKGKKKKKDKKKKNQKDSKKSKSGSQKSKTSGKSKKTKQTTAKSDRGAEVHLTVIDYDPYADVVRAPASRAALSPSSGAVSTLSDIEEHPQTPTELKRTDRELYKNNLYTIFYENLGRAVEDLEALLILQSKLTARHNIIQKVTDGFTVQTEHQPETVKVVDLRRVISAALDSQDGPRAGAPTRPCHAPIVAAAVPAAQPAASDSSLWDILQGPRLPVAAPEPGEYLIERHLTAADTRDAATSITRPASWPRIAEYADGAAQVDPWQLPRNVDCDLYCRCADDSYSAVRRLTSSRIRFKVRAASDSYYPELVSDGTQNFRFYQDSDEGEAARDTESICTGTATESRRRV